MHQWTRLVAASVVLLAVSSGLALAAEPRDFQGHFQDTVIQVSFVKVGSRVSAMYLGDIEDSKHYMSVVEKFVAGQTVTFSVWERSDYRVTFWGAENQLEPVKSEPLDMPAGKGFKLTYDDGTVVEIIA